jgi:cation transport ATPase
VIGAAGLRRSVLAYCAALEKLSEHPLAQAITAYATEQTAPVLRSAFLVTHGQRCARADQGKRLHSATQR